MIRIVTPRFLLRSLIPDDASERYGSWLDEDTARRFIAGAADPHDMTSLRAYIAEKNDRDDTLFLGIFALESGEHIGNIKYEPIDVERRYAVMGILIGDPSWRGKGVAQEVIEASADWLRANLNIAEIVLGVSRDNAPGIRAYEKAGFSHTTSQGILTDSATSLVMVRRLGDHHPR